MAMCRRYGDKSVMLRRNPACPNQLLYRVDRSFTRAGKGTNAPDPCAPLFNHAQLCLRGAIMPIGTTRFGRGVAVPPAIDVARAPTLNNSATVPTRVSTPTHFLMVQPATNRTTKMFPRLVCAKISPPSIRFITVKTRKGNHTALVRPAYGARPRHGTPIYFDGQFGLPIDPHGVAGSAVHRHGRSRPRVSMLRAAEKPTCFRVLDASRLSIEHVRALRQRTDPHFAASDVGMRRPPCLLCSTRTAKFLMQARGLTVTYLLLAAFARKHSAAPGITTFGCCKRTVPILALRVMRIYSTVTLHGDKDMQAGTIRTDTRYLDATVLATRLLGCFYPNGANIVQDTLARAVMPDRIVRTYRERLATRATYPLSRGVPTDRPAVFLIPGGSKGRTTALTRARADRIRTLPTYLGFALYCSCLAIALSALRMPLWPHATAPNRNKIMGTGTLRPSAADLNTAKFTTNPRRSLHPSRTVRLLATRVGTVFTRPLCGAPCLECTPAHSALALSISLLAFHGAVPLQGPRNRERCGAATAGAYQNQLSQILGVSKSALL